MTTDEMNGERTKSGSNPDVARLLLVEDEPSLLLTLEDRLRAEGYAVETATDGESALERAVEEDFDLVVLDVMLPRKNGFDVCRDLRQRGQDMPVLMLTARSQVVDKVVGLKLGADDYLTKPFDTLELLARIEALLRRRPAAASSAPAAGPGQVALGEVVVDLERGEAIRDGEPVELSALEWKLLVYLVEHPDTVLSRDQLLDEVWGYDATPQTRTVDVHVSTLRQKLEETPGRPRHILTVHGRGYKLKL